MKEQDIRAIESMCNIGMSLEVIISSFPMFPEEEIKAIFDRVNKERQFEDDSDIGISINCS